jgi:hypothetical protein
LEPMTAWTLWPPLVRIWSVGTMQVEFHPPQTLPWRPLSAAGFTLPSFPLIVVHISGLLHLPTNGAEFPPSLVSHWTS